ncbi:dUTPase [Paenibacillus rhizosphaerae]|uniref:dUTPase n=1 Tax=Paenibacillus rhizosphaerae TaxID=297318 RepID=A0A1R1ES63_9BACL|nr:dUTP diphosphatase [Paenibacillus rhizosphaerae]OMF54703.1 dUTPase [Paenibacillus rhizosphaerae]
MNLTKLFEMQRELDERIVKEKGLEGQDLLPQKILALQVELGECANEWRGFKFWSKDQKPRTELQHLCTVCDGTGDENSQANLESRLDGGSGYPYLECEECGGTGKLHVSNPLLEEYIDCLHFILSIGLDIGFDPEEALYLIDHNVQIFKSLEGITQQFNDIFTAIAETLLEGTIVNADYENYEDLVLCFIGLGEMLGFTWDQIEEAYMSKNAVNHERQSTGY